MKPCLRHLATASLLLFAGAALAGPPSLTWRGDITTANNMVEDMAKAWHKAGHPSMSLQPFNTVSGIDAVASGSADIAGSVRGRAPRRGNEKNLVFTPVAWDALTIITNPRNPVDNLTLKQLHDIYYGKITNWSEVGGKNEPINVYAVASPTDGIEFSLRRLLFGRGNQPVAAPRLYLNVSKLERAVELDPQSLGVTTLSNVHANGKVKMLAIDNTRPSVANVADGSYPLYTPLYLVSRPAPAADPAPGEADVTAGEGTDTATADSATAADGARAEQVAQFVAFAQSPAVADILHQHHLIPYANASALDGHDEQRIAAIAQETGRRVYHHGTPTAAPGATYASRAGIAPTSGRTLEARQQMLAKRGEDSAAEVRAKAAEEGRRSLAAADTGSAGTDRVTWYTVASGDTLSKIAKQESVTVSQLRAWNNIKGNLIKVGQKIAIHHD